MLNKTKAYFLKRIKSFGFAFSGLFWVVKNEAHIKIHLWATLIVIAFSVFFQVSKTEWLVLLLIIAMVWIAEIFNSAIEKLSDFVSPEYHSKIKIIKDMAAAAVLVAAMAALIIGCIIFVPRIFEYFHIS